jgi:16S rRNA (cytosine1402-N4)-methyltransferase
LEANIYHRPVLLEEILTALTPSFSQSPPVFYADLTLGGGGHTRAFLEKFPKLQVLGIDQDIEAIDYVTAHVQPHFSDRLQLVHGNFSQAQYLLANYLKNFETAAKFNGILLDLGVSSWQFDNPMRGFSFQEDGPLDMRMDSTHNEVKACDLINNLPEKNLIRIFEDYGEERFAKRIAGKIIAARKEKLFHRTKELEELVFYTYPRALRKGRTHPATRVFQALRIAVNRELEILADTISQVIPFLANEGVLAIISFHSLEDRIVKRQFAQYAVDKSSFTILTKKPITATPEEVKNNPRSRSAKLRILVKK